MNWVCRFLPSASEQNPSCINVGLIRIYQVQSRQNVSQLNLRQWTSSPSPESLMQCPSGSVVEHLPDNAGEAGDVGSIPGRGRCPGEGNDSPLQYSHWENPKARGVWQAIAHGVAKSWTWLSVDTQQGFSIWEIPPFRLDQKSFLNRGKPDFSHPILLPLNGVEDSTNATFWTLYIFLVIGLAMAKTGTWGEESFSFVSLDFWKWESEEVILLTNLETKKTKIPKVRALPGRKCSHKASQQPVAKGKQHLQDTLKLNSNIFEPFTPKWGLEAAIFKDQIISVFL